jgi:hypothetical protein
MKNKRLSFAHEEAKIYKHLYRPTFNVFGVVRYVAGFLLNGLFAKSNFKK